jgi:transcriptional regulatory protein RtcR
MLLKSAHSISLKPLFSGKLLQTGSGSQNTLFACFEIIDLELSISDFIAKRFYQEIKDDISFLKSGIKTKNVKFNALKQEKPDKKSMSAID